MRTKRRSNAVAIAALREHVSKSRSQTLTDNETKIGRVLLIVVVPIVVVAIVAALHFATMEAR